MALPKVQEDQDKPDRAKGLKPLTTAGIGNTEVGLSVEKTADMFIISNISSKALNNVYTIKIPDRVSLNVMDVQPVVESEYMISKMKGEINFTSLNSKVYISDVSGPIVATATNGSIEIIYSALTPEKPNAISSVNGFVDITLPAAAEIDLNLNTVNGEAFTDFEVKVDSDITEMNIPNFQMTAMAGKINGGGIPFTISTVNGDIYLRKK
jgi:hypothetical protein